jgi:hypothetical protein
MSDDPFITLRKSTIDLVHDALKHAISVAESWKEECLKQQQLANELEQLVTELRKVVETNHKWHQDHDDYDGYTDSELCTLNEEAIRGQR